MSNDWKYPILIIHDKISIEIINSPSDTYHYLSGHPTSFVGENFIDAASILWKITDINVLGGREPNSGWRFPWSNPPSLFVRELNYKIGAERIRELSRQEVGEIILKEVEKSELWSERLGMLEWKEKLRNYVGIEKIFNEFRRGRRGITVV